MADTVPPPPVPAVLRLVQTVVAGRWRATGEELYREGAALLGDGAGKEFLVVGAGEGVTVEWLASRTGAGLTGIDADRSRVSKAGRRPRASRASLHLPYEHAPTRTFRMKTRCSTRSSPSRRCPARRASIARSGSSCV